MLESTISVNSRTLSKRVDEGQWYQAPLALYPSGALFRPIPFNPTSTIGYLRNHFTAPSTPEHNIAQETFRLPGELDPSENRISKLDSASLSCLLQARGAERAETVRAGSAIITLAFLLLMTGPIALLDGWVVGAWLSLC
jgi:hypothetical protein